MQHPQSQPKGTDSGVHPYRCPQGHADVTAWADSYRCRPCGQLYRGDPIHVDTVDEFPADGEAHAVDEITSEDCLCVLAGLSDPATKSKWHSTETIAQELPGTKQQVASRIAAAHANGLVEPWGNSGSNANQWALTDTGDEAVAELRGESR